MNQKTLKIIFLSYLVVVFVGAIILMLPFAHIGKLSFIDALFTSTSATCVTGLVVKVTPEDFTFFGQFVLMILMQVGGVGYMSIVTLFFLVMRKNLNIHEKNMAKDSLNYSSNLDVQDFLKKVFIFTLLIECVGIVILTLCFWKETTFLKALWHGIFHTIAAFNNAGFSTFSDNLVGYQHNFTILFTIATLIILGGLGYLVLVELHLKAMRKKFMLSAHTKITLLGTMILLFSGMVLFLAIEWDTYGLFEPLSLFDKLLNSFFLSVNFRTSGFNSLDLSRLSDASLFCSTIYMMTGGGAGSTAGGIKITTVAVLIIATIHTMKISNQPPHAFKRTISAEIINRSSAIILVASLITITATVILVETQRTPFMKTLFEVVSAFCTVGVSVGNGDVLSFSDRFNTFGKSIIIVLMLIGRMGIFAFGFLLVGKRENKTYSIPRRKDFTVKTYAVVGLGKFGFNIAKGLAEQGMDIIAVDNDPHKIQEISEYIEDAIVLDSTDIRALKEAGIVGLDTVIISIGENIEASILTLMALKELDNKNIIAKAITLTHGEILARLGAFKVIYPERESARKLVENLVGNVVIDQIDFSSTIKIAKFLVPKALVTKSIKEIEKMFENEIHLVACKTRDTWKFDIDKSYAIREGDMLAFIGKKMFIEKLRTMTKKAQ